MVGRIEAGELIPIAKWLWSVGLLRYLYRRIASPNFALGVVRIRIWESAGQLLFGRMDDGPLRKAEIDALVDNVPESLFLTAEFRAELRRYEHFRKSRKRVSGRRPPNTYGEECDGA